MGTTEKKIAALAFSIFFSWGALAAGPSLAAGVGSVCDTNSDCGSGLDCKCDPTPTRNDGSDAGVCADPGAVVFCSPLEAQSFDDLVYSVTNFIFNIAMALVPVMVIIAGFYFITAAGDPERIKTAKKIILWTFVGLLIVLLTYGLIDVLKNLL